MRREESLRFEYSNCNCIVVGSEVSEVSEDSDNSEVSDNSNNYSQLTPPPISQPSIPPQQRSTDYRP